MREGRTWPLTCREVLIITPYNAQVATLTALLSSFRMGTAEKFQRQEAPNSIYSMATSSAEEAPRGMELLYSLHRLNVATRRTVPRHRRRQPGASPRALSHASTDAARKRPRAARRNGNALAARVSARKLTTATAPT
jgi:hypothetical protein